MVKKTTSWGSVASWYDELIKSDNSYQNNVILPNILRLMNIKTSDTVLDLACGSGYFSNEFREFTDKVIGVDIGKELISIAKKNYKNIEFHVSSSDDLNFIKDDSIDKISIVLALQNIENIKNTLHECYRVLKNKGEVYIILNHPCFRIPKKSDWGFDDKNKIIYRKIEEYMTESKIKIDMSPGKKESNFTVSFHRPLQLFFKIFSNTGFLVKRLEEWNSHKISQEGPRKNAEDKSRKEFPLFMAIELIKYKN